MKLSLSFIFFFFKVDNFESGLIQKDLIIKLMNFLNVSVSEHMQLLTKLVALVIFLITVLTILCHIRNVTAFIIFHFRKIFSLWTEADIEKKGWGKGVI